MDWQAARDTLLRDLITRKRLGVVSDLDGTLSRIAPSPPDANISPRAKQLLLALHERLPLVAVVSGRGVADLRDKVGMSQLIYVGNHGLEHWHNEQVVVHPEAVAYRPALEQALGEIRGHVRPGMFVEDKGATASIHYRQADNPSHVRERLLPIMQDIAARYGMKLFEGRMIFEVRPPVALDKGTAFRHLVQDYQLDAAVFLGDDVTDVDGMRVARQMRERGECYALALGVDASGTPDVVLSTADVTAAGVTGVEDFLEWLLNAVSASST